ncbi:ABC transporter ATP-binding protein [Hyphomicrobium sulfonivorans]|uniref:ABC transporter ATP-binding protein n=1 Tax=Hyphomicrobium sulfonivorans TaxID=121290 RepID=UPI00156D670E|nr:ABC transporter ATP-binding protein [Hyphomicrobium sulfonivorans]MBI1648696.1 ABC transporter ATP-binding protein [Hyphomicrobium sulfonivorans]NSL70768.1 methionine ABC transporter ATP-binding protein [Hyphomicrobium sulfonivorans]
MSAATIASPASAASNADDVVRMRDVKFRWPGARGFGLQIDSFTLPARAKVLLVGPSGTGKSTFLSLLCGIVAPSSGTLEVMGTDLTRLSHSARDRFRVEHFGIIFQMFNLLPYGSVLDNVMLPLSFSSVRARRASQGGTVEAEARRLLDSLGLDAHQFANHSTAALSVGQQQRVAAARALIGAPEIIVADEPTSALDRNRQLAFLDLLFAEADKAGAAVIMVSHEEELGTRFDQVVRLDEICRAQRGSAAA